MKIKTKLGLTLMIIAILFGFITRIVSVFQYITFDIGPDPDQIRDAFIVMKMWEGKFPLLGPVAYGLGLGGHHLLPLYYYVFFPFTILGGDPVFQALPNALFSFLSIPLLIYLVYQLLENIDLSQRIFLSGLAGVWYSVLFGDIFISNFQWNPSSIPFFFLSFLIIYDLQIKNHFSWIIQCCLWALNGVVFAILISLHTSTLLVMPIVFIISIFLYVFEILKNKQEHKLLFLPVISCVSAFIALTPYWKGEFSSRFSNTKALLQTIRAGGSAASDMSLFGYIWVKISNLVMNYVNVMRQAYFWNSSLLYLIISFVFLTVITFYSITFFRGNKYIGSILISTLGVFLLAAANIEASKSVFYYKIIILSLPVIMSMITLAYLSFSLQIRLLFIVLVTVVMGLSMVNNLFYDYGFLQAKYGQNRLINTHEIAKIMKDLPAGATICDPRIVRKRNVRNQYNYINTYVVNNDLKTVAVCEVGNYVIHSKRFLQIESNFLNDNQYKETYFLEPSYKGDLKLWPILSVSESSNIARASKLFLEMETASVYILE